MSLDFTRDDLHMIRSAMANDVLHTQIVAERYAEEGDTRRENISAILLQKKRDLLAKIDAEILGK